MVDMDSLLKGQDYSELKESFIIFICNFDPFHQDLPCYTFKNICIQDKNLELCDETTKIIFNSTAYSKEKNLEISAFLKYINTKIPTNDFTKKLNNLVEESKINNKFRNDYLAMNLHDRDIRWVALEEGRKEGAELTKIETAKKFLQEGLPVEQIARCTDLPLEKVQELANITQN
jgi:predicted transposase/invertase (TIGR01784 family)